MTRIPTFQIPTTARFRRRALVIAIIAVALALVAWNVPQLDFLLYPLRLFVTFVHESGHGLGALLSGGQFVRLTVNSDGSGLASTAGGSRALILPLGYLGAAAFGAGLFYLTNRLPRRKWLAIGLGGIVLLMTVSYTELLSSAFFVGLLMAGALILLGARAHEEICLLVLNFLAVICGLNAVFDLLFLINNSNIGNGVVRNDAAAFSNEVAPLVPAWFWAVLWAALAIVMLVTAVWFSFRHAWRGR